MTTLIAISDFGKFEGRDIYKYTLSSESGLIVSVINYGATITNIFVPDSTGNLGDVVLGYNSLAGYLQKENPYFGAACGRFANRIAGASYTYKGEHVQLSNNEGIHLLHGGIRGFDKHYWQAETDDINGSVTFSLVSPAGDQGFPGELKVSVTYTVHEQDLSITYEALADHATPVNLTNHSYFNLSGDADKDIYKHELQLRSDRFVEINDELIPTGRLYEVQGTVMDFNENTSLSKKGVSAFPYDHCFVLNNYDGTLKKVAQLSHPQSCRQMEVFTTEPGIQLYTGNFLDGNLSDTKNNMIYKKHAALCLETQHFPDSPNQPHFPNVFLSPGKIFKSETMYRFRCI